MQDASGSSSAAAAVRGMGEPSGAAPLPGVPTPDGHDNDGPGGAHASTSDPSAGTAKRARAKLPSLSAVRPGSSTGRGASASGAERGTASYVPSQLHGTLPGFRDPTQIAPQADEPPTRPLPTTATPAPAPPPPASATITPRGGSTTALHASLSTSASAAASSPPPPPGLRLSTPPGPATAIASRSGTPRRSAARSGGSFAGGSFAAFSAGSGLAPLPPQGSGAKPRGTPPLPSSPVPAAADSGDASPAASSLAVAGGLGGGSPLSAAAPPGGHDALSLRLHVLTFNMAGVAVSALPRGMFGGYRGADRPDVYAVCTQEACAEADLDRLLCEALPAPAYVKVGSRSLMDIGLQVYAIADVAPLVAVHDATTVATGIGNILGNKGGIAFSLMIASVSVLLVSSHLAAHDEFVDRRNADFHRICAGLPLPPRGGGEAGGSGSGGIFSGVEPEPPAGAPPPAPPLRAASQPPPAAATPARGAGAASLASPSTRGVGGDGGSGGFGCIRGAVSNVVSPVPRAASLPSLATAPARLRSIAGGGGVHSSGGFGFSSGSFGTHGPSALSPLRAATTANVQQQQQQQQQQQHPHVEYASAPGTPARCSGVHAHALRSASGSIGSGGLEVGSEGGGASPSPPSGVMRHVSSVSTMGDGGSSARGRAALEGHDVVVWAGDLNYRIKGTTAGVLAALTAGMHEVLLVNDQLRAEQRAGRAFVGFREQPLTFPPTFKHVMNSDEYNPKRVPSWTDRVLFMCNAHPGYCTLRPTYYTCVHEMKESDHRPVVAGFQMVVVPQNRQLGRASALS
ncbi:hypothetical protein FOA52_001300 [Chlamydomonas sp. UWO 241]|nr:hypothetical protein FOA52_001300 [Chlamydomonas sp. UWO 241]